MSEETVKAIIFGLGVGVGIFLTILISDVSYKPLEKKCAETQGRYDFCVQKISYEVKK